MQGLAEKKALFPYVSCAACCLWRPQAGFCPLHPVPPFCLLDLKLQLRLPRFWYLPAPNYSLFWKDSGRTLKAPHAADHPARLTFRQDNPASYPGLPDICIVIPCTFVLYSLLCQICLKPCLMFLLCPERFPCDSVLILCCALLLPVTLLILCLDFFILNELPIHYSR